MRVLHIHSGNLYGGVETFLSTLAKCANLCPGMESVFALCFTGRLNEELQGHGGTVHMLGEVKIRYAWKIFYARQALRNLLLQQKYDTVVCHSAWSQAIFAPVVHRAKLPLILYLHGQANKMHWLDRWASRTQPDCVISNSYYTQTSVRTMYPAVRSEVAYLPIPAPQFVRAEDRTAVRAELDTPADAVVIIQVSRLEPGKGHDIHLQALAQVREVPGWICWIVGGPQRPHEHQYLSGLKATAAAIGIADRIRFLGERADVPRLLGAADVFCQPNTGPESFGISLIEALYAGLPVVTSNIGGGREIVTDSCGVLVPANDTRALAKELTRLVTSPELRRTLSCSGPNRARALVEPHAQLNKIYELFCSIVLEQESLSGKHSEATAVAHSKIV